MAIYRDGVIEEGIVAKEKQNSVELRMAGGNVVEEYKTILRRVTLLIGRNKDGEYVVVRCALGQVDVLFPDVFNETGRWFDGYVWKMPGGVFEREFPLGPPDVTNEEISRFYDGPVMITEDGKKWTSLFEDMNGDNWARAGESAQGGQKGQVSGEKREGTLFVGVKGDEYVVTRFFGDRSETLFPKSFDGKDDWFREYEWFRPGEEFQMEFPEGGEGWKKEDIEGYKGTPWGRVDSSGWVPSYLNDHDIKDRMFEEEKSNLEKAIQREKDMIQQSAEEITDIRTEIRQLYGNVIPRQREGRWKELKTLKEDLGVGLWKNNIYRIQEKLQSTAGKREKLLEGFRGVVNQLDPEPALEKARKVGISETLDVYSLIKSIIMEGVWVRDGDRFGQVRGGKCILYPTGEVVPLGNFVEVELPENCLQGVPDDPSGAIEELRELNLGDKFDVRLVDLDLFARSKAGQPVNPFDVGDQEIVGEIIRKRWKEEELMKTIQDGEGKFDHLIAQLERLRQLERRPKGEEKGEARGTAEAGGATVQLPVWEFGENIVGKKEGGIVRGDGFCSVWSVLVAMVFEGYMTPEQAVNEITNSQIPSFDGRTPIHAYILWLLEDWKLEDGTLRPWKTRDNRDGIPWDSKFQSQINRSSKWVSTLHTSNLFRVLAKKFKISVEVGLYTGSSTKKVLTRVVYGKKKRRITVVSTGPHYNVWSRKVNPEKLGRVKEFYQKYLYHTNLARISNKENEREKTQDIIARLGRLILGEEWYAQLIKNAYTKEKWKQLITGGEGNRIPVPLGLWLEDLEIENEKGVVEYGPSDRPNPKNSQWKALEGIFEETAAKAVIKEKQKLRAVAAQKAQEGAGLGEFEATWHGAPGGAFKDLRGRYKGTDVVLEEKKQDIMETILGKWFPKNQPIT